MPSIWTQYEVTPVEIAMPGNKVGLTLRAYRQASALTPTDVTERESDDDVFAERVVDRDLDEDELPEFEWTQEQLDAIAAEPSDDPEAESFAEAKDSADAEDDDTDDEDDDEVAAVDQEEVPVFLSHKGKILLFKTAAGLVSYIQSSAPHDMQQLEGWSKLAKAVKVSDVVAADDDNYELDLVVENLRGGPEVWDGEILLSAGELARDLGYALQIKPILVALSAGSPLDDLDDALRAADEGGFSSFRARRRLKKIGAEQASLGWRTIIGKISAAVDWRD